MSIILLKVIQTLVKLIRLAVKEVGLSIVSNGREDHASRLGADDRENCGQTIAKQWADDRKTVGRRFPKQWADDFQNSGQTISKTAAKKKKKKNILMEDSFLTNGSSTWSIGDYVEWEGCHVTHSPTNLSEHFLLETSTLWPTWYILEIPADNIHIKSLFVKDFILLTRKFLLLSSGSPTEIATQEKGFVLS